MLVRTNSAGGTREFLDYLTDHHLEHSVGSGLWTTAYDLTEPNVGAWTAELTGMLDVSAVHRPQLLGGAPPRHV